MAIAYGTSVSSVVSGATTITLALTVGTGEALFVFVTSNGTTETISSVTYDGVALSVLVALFDSSGAGVKARNSLYGLHNPTTGASRNIIATYSGSGGYHGVFAATYSGVDTTSVASMYRTPYTGGDSGAGTGKDLTVVNSVSGDLVLASSGNYPASPTLTAGGSATRRIQQAWADSYQQAIEDIQATGASTVMTWGSDAYCSNIALALIPAAAAATPPRTLMLTGVGR